MRKLPSRQRAMAIAAAIAVAAIALQWALSTIIGPRAPFLFFIPAVIGASVIAGARFGLLLVAIGMINAAWLLEPSRSLHVASGLDVIAVIVFGLVGMSTAIAGHYHRRALQRSAAVELDLVQTKQSLQQQLADLHELHDLSTSLNTLQTLPEQLRRILDVLLELHGAQFGYIAIHDRPSDRLNIIASRGFSETALETFAKLRGETIASGRAVGDRRRIIADIEQNQEFVRYLDIARQVGFRAVHSTPLLGRTNEILGTLAVHFVHPHVPTQREIAIADICARKAALLIERAQAEEAVRERDQRLRAVLDSSAVAFDIIAPVRDADGAIVDFEWAYVNRAAGALFGLAPDELVGRRVGEMIPSSWSHPGLFDKFVHVAERNEPLAFEYQSRTNEGEVWLHVIASPLQGAVATWFADITQTKRQEIELREADRRKDEFLAILAHELRNPLAPIRQAAMIASLPTSTDAQKRWSHSVIERQVQHMSLLLEDLLDVSRITRGRLELRRQRTDLGSVISAAVEGTRPLIESRRHTLQLDVPNTMVPLNADPLRLAQILSNLLNNAAKYTDPQGVLRVSAREEGNDLVITVADNGIGIARDDLSKIFGMFSQVKAAQERSEGGLGIGLALTKGLVELHGGSIHAHSDGPGRGSVFTVRLPVIAKTEDAETAHAEERGSNLRLTRRILIADDNRDAAESLAVLLRAEGHEVDVAHDGERAYQTYLERRPDVLLLDIGMPRLSGYEVAKRVRAHSRKPLLIAITGWGQETDKSKALRAGFDHHLTKPVNYQHLSRLLQPRSAHAGVGVRTLS